MRVHSADRVDAVSPALCRPFHRVGAEIQRAAVVALENEETHNGWDPTCANASFSVMKLPSDFPIFRPSTVTILLCSQYFTNGLPVAPSLWAISHS